MANSEAISLLMNNQYYKQGYKQGVSDVLAKTRAEIEEYKSRQLTLAIGVDDLEKGKQIVLEYVLAILDKYKAEDGGEES